MRENPRNPSTLVQYFAEKVNRLPLLKNIRDALLETENNRKKRTALFDDLSEEERAEAMNYLRTKMFNPEYKKEEKEKTKLAFLTLPEKYQAVLEKGIEKYEQDDRLQILDENQGQIKDAYAMIRYHLLSQEPNGQETVSDDEFRLASEYIIEHIFQQAVKNNKNFVSKNTLAAYPWRGGLAFALAGKKAGIQHLAHLDVRRNERTAEAELNFESYPSVIDKKHPQNNRNLKVIINDPMLATGGTMLNSIERLLRFGVKEENIILAAVVTAPEGVFRLLDKFPKLTIITGAHDEKLNGNAYIEKGLGDFGDLYFRKLGNIFVNELVKLKILTEDQAIVLLNRMRKSMPEHAKT